MARALRDLVRQALEEDVGPGDITSAILPPAAASGRFLAKSHLVLCGTEVAAEVFRQTGARARFAKRDGTFLREGTVFGTVRGPAPAVLSGERVALNFLQRLSGIATATRALVDAVAGLDATILDTRKTSPGLRALDRYAVRAGGGRNHRFNLADAVLIKDNHLTAARARGLTIADALAQARAAAPEGMRIEIEVTSVDEARQALDAGAGALLLDNMSLDDLRAVVAFAKGRALLEASGGVTLATVRDIAATGVDCISAGSITHSAPALDISLELEAGPRS